MSAGDIRLLWPGRCAQAAPPAVERSAVEAVARYGATPEALSESGRLVFGDHRRVLAGLRSELRGSVHLVYLDPPFATGATRHGRARLTEDLSGEASTGEPPSTASYADRGGAHLPAVLSELALTLDQVRDLLHPEGSVLVHCDFRLAPYLALICDETFGPGDRRPGPLGPGFRNEIVWAYGLGGSSPRYYPRKHDVLLWYTRGASWYFAPPRVPATSQRMRGQLKKCPDVWTDIPSLNNRALERTGYPTQKPLALMERVLEAHSRPGDLVLDPVCGSGTTLVAAAGLGRRWIGCDRSPLAMHTSRRRLRALHPAPTFTFEVDRGSEGSAAEPWAEARVEALREGRSGLRLRLVLGGSSASEASRRLDSWSVDWDHRPPLLEPSWTATRGPRGGSLPMETPLHRYRASGRYQVAVEASSRAGRDLRLAITVQISV